MSELKIERTFSADAKTVFAFITETEHLLKWWGPEGMSVPIHELDLSKPGAWTSTMVNSEGGKHKVSGEVIAVDPPNSVEFSWGWHDENDARGHDSVVRFEVQSNNDGGTNFTMIHSNLADDESAKNHNMGWSSSFNKLERLAS